MFSIVLLSQDTYCLVGVDEFVCGEIEASNGLSVFGWILFEEDG